MTEREHQKRDVTKTERLQTVYGLFSNDPSAHHPEEGHISMDFERYIRVYPEEELVQGAERYFAGEIRNFTVRKAIPAADQLLFEPWRKTPASQYTTIIRTPDKDACINLRGEWTDTTDRNQKHGCSLSLYGRMMTPVEASCDCDIFGRSRVCCPHITALLTGYLVSCQGEDVLRGTRIEQDLQNRTGAEDPFNAAALKRTDDRILSMLSVRTEEKLPVFQQKINRKMQKRVEAECLLTAAARPGRICAEILAGPGRHYVIRNLREFLRAYRMKNDYTFGKNSVLLASETCDPFTVKLLDHLSGLQARDEELGRRAQRYITDGNAASSRQMILDLAEADTLMEILDGQNRTTIEDIPCAVRLNERMIKLIIRKKAYGATIQIADAQLFFSSAVWYYLINRDCLYRVPKSLPFLREMLSWKDAVYVRDSELPSVLDELLPWFEQYGEIIAKGLIPENYEREKPSFRFQLDLEEDGTLICVPYAVYPKQEKEYLLYDNRKDKTRRNAQEESRIGDILGGMFDAYDPDAFALSAFMEDDRLFDFMKDHLPVLESMGIVMATDAVTSRRIRKFPPVAVHVSVNGGKLLMSIRENGMTEEEITEILSSYQRKKKFHRLHSGSFVSFEETDEEALETISEIWQHYGADTPEKMQLPLYRALYLKEMLENRNNIIMDGTDNYRTLVEKIGRACEQQPVPECLKNVLRPYQEEGFRWIRVLKECGFGGILADDMGLGKTLQVLAFLLSEKEKGRSGDDLRTLIICPASLVYNWQKEIRTFTPTLKSLVISGQVSARRELIGSMPDADIWITSYDLLKRDIALYQDIHFANEIIDEAQFIKNQNAQASRSVRIVDSDFRLALTGTPIENHLGELWSILDYLMPGFLYTYNRFQKEYETPVAADHDKDALTRLRRIVHPFILRRLKSQVLKELPEKLEEVVTIRLEDDQKKLYDASAEELRRMLGKTSQQEFRSGKLQFLSRLTRLRQLCCDPSLLYEQYTGGSAKLEACLQLVHEAVNSGHKLLLFSQFTSMLDIICKRLSEDGLAFHRLDGSTSKENRMQMVDSFANDDVPVFCISLKAGGTGLNLTAADIVIHYDPWWNQAAQDQATDRAHRIGQTQRVNVYELIAGDTIEEQIVKLKESKTQLADDILTGDSISSTLINRDDLLQLLQ